MIVKCPKCKRKYERFNSDDYNDCPYCMPKNRYFWKILSCIIILLALILLYVTGTILFPEPKYKIYKDNVEVKSITFNCTDSYCPPFQLINKEMLNKYCDCVSKRYCTDYNIFCKDECLVYNCYNYIVVKQ